MKRDSNFEIFAGHPEWYVFDEEVGYIPTEIAPPEAVRAMEEYYKYGV